MSMNEIIMSILTLILVGITGYYAYLTKSLSKSSTLAIQHTTNINSERKIQDDQTKSNYLFLLNSELAVNSLYYVMALHYFQQQGFSDKLLQFLGSGKAIKSKGIMKEYASVEIWDSIKNECAKSFSNILMQEFAGYYSGVQVIRFMTLDGVDNKNFIDFAKNQLVSTYKCFDLIDKETDQQFRRNETIDIENFKYQIDKNTGDLKNIIPKPNEKSTS
jgi:hypothetical protein